MVGGVVRVSDEACGWLKRGALHVYAQNVVSADASPGDFVEVRCNDFVAFGFYNPSSSIAVKVLSWDEVDPLDFVLSRMERLWKEKSSWGWDAFRWVFAEGDLISGLIVDVYRDVAVFKIHNLGIERFKEDLVEFLSTYVDGIIERNDDASRDKEGLPRVKRVWRGRYETEIEEGGARFVINALEGQKTGFYLDQRENRVFSEEMESNTALDVFSYTGGFGIHIGLSGARVTFVEQGRWEQEMIRKHMELNGVRGKVLGGDAVDVMRRLIDKGEHFDVVSIDPPALAKDRSSTEKAKRMYFLLNRLALRLVKDGGVLLSSSCTHFLTPREFLGIVKGAAEKEGVRIRLMGHLRGQSRDHTVYLPQPETRYLKFGAFWVEK